jgi:hypothetical protein
VDFIVAVAGHVFAQFLKFAPLADLTLCVQAERAAMQK